MEFLCDSDLLSLVYWWGRLVHREFFQTLDSLKILDLAIPEKSQQTIYEKMTLLFIREKMEGIAGL